MRKTRKDLIIAYKWFSTVDGQKVLDDLKKKAPLITEGTDCSKLVDSNRMFIQLGRADVVKYICKMVGKDPLEEREQFAQGE